MRRDATLVSIGVLTWFTIGVPSVVWAMQQHQLTTPRGFAWIGCFLLFAICFVAASLRRCSVRTVWMLRIAQTLLALACIALQANGVQPILLVIAAAQYGGLPVRAAAGLIALQTIAFSAILYSRHSTDPLLIALVYFTFQLFASVALHMAHSESVARQELAQANAELRLTTALLDMSSRTSERLRISRDLHDLLGHHLTALSLNLEVASHLATGEARDAIDKSKAITKLLLSDVRDVVSSMREDEPLDLAGALAALRDSVSTPAVHLDIAGDVAVADTAIAQAALRAVQEIITNAVRHSGARNLWLRLKTSAASLDIDARDDGGGADDLHFGNGLRGMRERVEQVRGSVDVATSPGAGFSVHVRLPLGAEPA